MLHLPPLRQELKLIPVGTGDTGAPSWVLQDPVAGRYFQLGWPEFEILSRWGKGGPDEVIQAVNADTTLEIGPRDLEQFLKFLSQHHLLQPRGEQAMAHLARLNKAVQRRSLGWVLKNYLFLRIPLIHPDGFLTATHRFTGFFWTIGFALFTLLCGALGSFLVLRQWDVFWATLPRLFSVEGAIMAGAVLTITKILHEFGHGYALKHYGCRVPSMGVALLVFWPVLYTDASDSWRLSSRRQRLVIAGAGIAVELALAVFATLLWSFLDDGPTRSAVFLLATTTWIMTLLVNLNPLMRFDGYYLLSDLLNVPNLQERGFAFGRWHLRKTLFGWTDRPPEPLPPVTGRALILYAYATWIYRFFLFLGIALLVYFLVFKALGLFLMVMQLVWVLFRPVKNEILVWYERRNEMRLNLALVRTLVVGALALAAFLVPWQGRVFAPALLQAQEQIRIYAPMDARIVTLPQGQGDRVAEGDLLVRLNSPDLGHEITLGQAQVETLEWQMGAADILADLRERRQVLFEELARERVRLEANLADRARNTLLSPLTGRISEVQPNLSPGDWVAEDDWLMTLVDDSRFQVEAYVAERDIRFLEPGKPARFYPETPEFPVLDLIAETVEQTSSRSLQEPRLASVLGGQIPVREGPDGELLPEEPVYRVVFSTGVMPGTPLQELRGQVTIAGARHSLAAQVRDKVLSVLVRESGF